MKHQFNEGDGVTHLTATVEEREKIFNLLKENKYPLYANYVKSTVGWSNFNQFQNNFRFNKQGKWVTSSRQQVTNPMTFDEFKRLIENKGEPNYEIY